MLITFTANSIQFTDNAGNNVLHIQKSQVVNVTGVFTPVPNTENYPFANVTEVSLALAHGGEQKFELQRVTNQPTWNGGSQADLNQAISDIQAAL